MVARTAQIGACGEKMFVQMFNRQILALDGVAQPLRQIGDHRHLILRQSVKRYAGPFSDDGGNLLLSTCGETSRCVL